MWRQARARQSSMRPLHLEVVSWWKSHGAVVVGAHSKCTQRRQLKWPSGEVAVCWLRMVPRQLDNLTEETWARILSQVDGNWLKSLGKCRSNTMCVCSLPFYKIRFRSANVWILCVAFLSLWFSSLDVGIIIPILQKHPNWSKMVTTGNNKSIVKAKPQTSTDHALNSCLRPLNSCGKYAVWAVLSSSSVWRLTSDIHHHFWVVCKALIAGSKSTQLHLLWLAGYLLLHLNP